MQNFDFGTLRGGQDRDYHDSYEDYGSRAVSSVYPGYNGKATSSVYSGPGPAEESAHHSLYGQNVQRQPIEEEQPQQRNARPQSPRGTSTLNVNDPIAMHLLMETAIGDSKSFGVLSYDELESLKRERASLASRVESTGRKLALESKLRDAAQSLNRLYSTHSRRDSGDTNTESSPRKFRRSLLGGRNSNNDTISRTDDEFAASSKKCEELSAELSQLEKRLEEVNRKILEHTAGMLQMTHRGLKKNINRGELPRSPESMISLNHRSIPPFDGVDDFDERSYYRSTDFSAGNGHSLNSAAHTQALQDAEKGLDDLNNRLHGMMLQSDAGQRIEPPPRVLKNGAVPAPGAQIQTHLDYLALNLDKMGTMHAQKESEVDQFIYDSEDRLQDINLRLEGMLKRTASVGQAPIPMPAEARGRSMQSQLSFSAMVLDRLNQRLDLLVEQKDILTRQIQQQRELNSKSDAERETQILNLTKELEDTTRLHLTEQNEAQRAHSQVNLLMEQLDAARQEAVLAEQQRGMHSDKALRAEKESRRQAEEGLFAELKSKQEQNTSLQAEIAKLQNGMSIQEQHHHQQVNELTKAKGDAEIEIERCRAEMKELESEVVRAQTDLTVVRAELDGAYGTRAQRAADVSMNPAIQSQIDDLNDKNVALQKQVDYLQSRQESAGAGSAELQEKVEVLQKELKETIEDYELMTRSSIEFEKERDQFEATIDTYRERVEALEAQLSDEKVQLLGAKGPGQNGPSETTSSMILKNEFKKMMRDTRAENMKALRAEQDERRRLESVIRALKKEQQQWPARLGAASAVAG